MLQLLLRKLLRKSLNNCNPNKATRNMLSCTLIVRELVRVRFTRLIFNARLTSSIYWQPLTRLKKSVKVNVPTSHISRFSQSDAFYRELHRILWAQHAANNQRAYHHFTKPSKFGTSRQLWDPLGSRYQIWMAGFYPNVTINRNQTSHFGRHVSSCTCRSPHRNYFNTRYWLAWTSNCTTFASTCPQNSSSTIDRATGSLQ